MSSTVTRENSLPDHSEDREARRLNECRASTCIMTATAAVIVTNHVNDPLPSNWTSSFAGQYANTINPTTYRGQRVRSLACPGSYGRVNGRKRSDTASDSDIAIARLVAASACHRAMRQPTIGTS